MSGVRVEGVVWAEPLPEAIEEIHLERPVVGGEWAGATVEVSGWVLARSSLPAAVEVGHGGKVLRRLPVRMRRLDVARQRPGREGAEECGFTGLVTVLGLPERLRLDLSVVLRDGTREAVGAIEGSRGPLRPAYEPTLQPLMVTTLGRMASTWMMSLLAAHPRIVALRRYPYECKTAKYWLQVLRSLAEPAMQGGDAGTVHADRWWVGVNPFLVPDMAREPRPGVGLYTERLAELCLRNIDSWYGDLAHGLIKEDVRYFAEKFTPTHLPALARELYPGAKEVFLVRDFRDWICSILAFDAKRGFHGFGRRPDEPVEEYVRRHARNALVLREQWEARRSSAHLVRYEDLVDAPEETLRGLLEYLELEAQPASIAALLEEADLESAAHPRHRTSTDARASVGRWRRELEPSVRQAAEEIFEPALETFGYGAGGDSEEAIRAVHV